MKKDTFTFKDKEYATLGNVANQVGHFSTLEEEVEFLDAYLKEHSSHAESNLRYLLGKNPYFVAFESKHILNKDLENAYDKVSELRNKIRDDFDNFLDDRGKKQ